jgi:hypothetical protein
VRKQEQRLLFYPIYIVHYQYESETTFTCLIDGITGHVTGDRQYSMIKVTLATFVGFYPLLWTALVGFGSMVDPSIAVALSSLLSLKSTLLLATICAPISKIVSAILSGSTFI